MSKLSISNLCLYSASSFIGPLRDTTFPKSGPITKWADKRGSPGGYSFLADIKSCALWVVTTIRVCTLNQSKIVLMFTKTNDNVFSF